VGNCRGALYVQYELQKELGEGAFGKAILARRRRDGELFVVKKMHATTLTEKAREEVLLYKTCLHRRFIRMDVTCNVHK
jgi:serine/threonine protein kinase